MDFEKVIKTRRSIRNYSGKDIPDSILKKILDAARIAPSGNNKQPWFFIVVKDSEKKKKIAEYSCNQNFIAEAPVVIVCCGKKYPNSSEIYGDNSYLVDVTIAIDHLILAARNEEIGSCWVGALHPEPIKNLLNVLENIDVLMVVPLGYSKEIDFKETSFRKSIDEIVSNEEYGKKFT